MTVNEFLKSKIWQESLQDKQIVIKSSYYNLYLTNNRLQKNQVDIGNKEIECFFIHEKEGKVDVYVKE